MSGVKGRSGRPGGNPDLENFQFSTDRSEPLTTRMQLRISESMWTRLQEEEDWRKFVREAIAEKLEKSPGQGKHGE